MNLNLLAHDPTEPPRFLSKPTYEALLKQIHALASARGVTQSGLDSTWRSDVRWARNRTTMTGDWRNVGVGVRRLDCEGMGKAGTAFTNQLDVGSLQGAVQWGETVGQLFQGTWASCGDNVEVPPPSHPPETYPTTHIWSDTTYTQTSEARVTLVNEVMAEAEAAGMLSAGYLAVEAGGAMLELPNRYMLYAPHTEGQCTVTVRDPEGSGSGWAGVSSYDWQRIDVARLAAIALDKCIRSRHPVRIEPGRYTVIMEPQATYDLLYPLFWTDPKYNWLDLTKNLGAERFPFWRPQTKSVKVSNYGGSVIIQTTRIGDRVFDTRLNLSFDPIDPELGRIPWDGAGYPIQPVQWIKNGVLETLSYEPHLHYPGMGDLIRFVKPKGKRNLKSFRLDAGTTPLTTVDEMIATTQRGVLVTRFWGVQVVDIPSVLLTGTTRDGVWLIERGKITHPVKNLRFTESPMFAFNQVEQIGATVPIFAPGLPATVPTVKVRDFSFTALEDAI